MTTHANGFTARASLIAVDGALIAILLAAFSGTAIAQGSSKPTSTVEVGPSAVSDGSYKAGEYNGFETQGANGIGNVDLRGGPAGFNNASTVRWRIKGTDLGVEERNVTAQVSSQGKFRLSLGFDQLRRNRSDTFQTPYDGAGSNVLTLPASWLVPTVAGSSGSSTNTNVTSARGLIPALGTAAYINSATNSTTMGGLITPTSTQIAQVLAAAGADSPLFHGVNLFTKRTRFDAAFNYSFDPRWTVDAVVRPEHKDGVKPMGTVSRNTGADMSTIIPDVVDNNHDQVNVGLNFKGRRSFAQAGYYGSMFHNNVPFMSWQNWATPTGTVNRISSPPSNNFNQFNLTAGLNLSPTAKLVANGSYGRATQNDSLLTDTTTPVVPVSSIGGLVVTTGFNAKFTARPAKKLNVSAAYKYDDRDNRTAVHIFQYADAGEAPAANANFPAGPTNPLGAVLAQNANANRPYSRTLNTATLDADYRILNAEWIKLGYDFERIDRGCTGVWTGCADAARTNENTARLEWRTNAGQDLSARIGYARSARRTPNYNENAFLALVPYAAVAPAGATDGASAYAFMIANGWNGWGPSAGYAPTIGNMNLFFPNNNALANGLYANNNRISELPGMRRYYVADRDRDKLRTSLSWQVSDALSFQAGLDVNHDVYPGATYGLQNARGWAADFDSSYALTEDWSVSLSYTYEDQRSNAAGNSYTANSNASAITNGQPGVAGLAGNSCDSFTTMQQRNNNNKLDPCLNWSSGMLDQVHTAGIGTRKQFGSFDVTGNVVLSRARWNNSVTGGNWANNILNGPGAAPTTIAAIFIPATPVPTVFTNSAELRLGGTYALGRGQAVRVSYVYLRMQSDDPAYEGMQFGSLSGVLPTNEQPFSYRVNVVGVSYVLSF